MVMANCVGGAGWHQKHTASHCSAGVLLCGLLVLKSQAPCTSDRQACKARQLEGVRDLDCNGVNLGPDLHRRMK